MIVKKVVYNEANDTLVGFYGKESLEHEYKQNFVIVIGERLEGYENITKAFEESRICGNARCVMANPIHPSLPKNRPFYYANL